MAICQQKLGAFLKQWGLGTWDYRLLETDPVPSDIRYQVLAAYNGRCALCGRRARSAGSRWITSFLAPRVDRMTSPTFRRCETNATGGSPTEMIVASKRYRHPPTHLCLLSFLLGEGDGTVEQAASANH
jgi:hypothetical protein